MFLSVVLRNPRLLPRPTTGDASSFFYNALRGKYVMSIKTGFWGRSRDYAEGDTLEAAALQSRTAHVKWASTDGSDHPCVQGGTGTHAEVYELMAVAYVSDAACLRSEHCVFGWPGRSAGG